MSSNMFKNPLGMLTGGLIPGALASGASTATSPAALPAPPTITPPPTMPDPMSPEAMDAQRRAARAANSGGRQSTILTTPGNRTAQPGTLAAGNYSGAKLGAA